MSYSDLTYQERILLVASNISKENQGRGYGVSWADEDLILEPWKHDSQGNIVRLAFLRVSDGMIYGKEREAVKELQARELILRNLDEALREERA